MLLSSTLTLTNNNIYTFLYYHGSQLQKCDVVVGNITFYAFLQFPMSYSLHIAANMHKLQFFFTFIILIIPSCKRQKLNKWRWNECKDYRHFCGRMRCANSAKRHRAARRHRGAPFFFISLYSSTCIRPRFDFTSTLTQ